MKMDSLRVSAFLGSVGSIAIALMSCSSTVDCVDGSCLCPEGRSCEFECAAPPCTTVCEGGNPRCDGACANGSCECGDDSDCSFTCDAPPCHVTCGDGTSCEGACANGDCECGFGSSCDFRCDAPPCHATCQGDNFACAAECANGTCSCGPDSACVFTCLSGPCHTTCAAGSQCQVLCPNGDAGTDGCDLQDCDGEVVICADGRAMACNAPCPPIE